MTDSLHDQTLATIWRGEREAGKRLNDAFHPLWQALLHTTRRPERITKPVWPAHVTPCTEDR